MVHNYYYIHSYKWELPIYFKVKLSRCMLAYKEPHSLGILKSIGCIFCSPHYKNSGLLAHPQANQVYSWALGIPHTWTVLPDGCMASSLVFLIFFHVYSTFLMRSTLTISFTILIDSSPFVPLTCSVLFSLWRHLLAYYKMYC